MNENSSIYPFFITGLILISCLIIHRAFIITDNIRDELNKGKSEDADPSVMDYFFSFYPLVIGPALVLIFFLLKMPKSVVIALVLLNVYSIIYLLWDQRNS